MSIEDGAAGMAETFVVRVWRPSPGIESDLRGMVEHVASQTRHRFTSSDELLALLAAPATTTPEAAASAPGTE
ncbi:MAG TPA: hypothetical protein VGC11_16045 [Acidimicrobiia bacterium]|jgi:hypothetical protein